MSKKSRLRIEKVDSQVTIAAPTAPINNCSICGGSDDEDCIILCDANGCTTETHMYCLYPPLLEVPIDNWYCESCAINKSDYSGTNSLVKYFVDFSSQFQLINPLRSLESYSHFLRALQLQHSDIKNFLAQSLDSNVVASEFEISSENLIGSLVRLYFSNDDSTVTVQCHTGRIIQRRCKDTGVRPRWEHQIHFKSGGDGRDSSVLEWVCLDEHACLVSSGVVWAKPDGFALYWPSISYYRSGVEICTNLADKFCGFDVIDSLVVNDVSGDRTAIGSSAISVSRSRVSSRYPPDYLLCQTLLEDTFSFVAKGKVFPFLEKMRDTNSMMKRLSVAYAMAWIEIEEREATRRGYFYGAECENGQNTYLSPLVDFSFNPNGNVEDLESAEHLLAAICNKELKRIKGQSDRNVLHKSEIQANEADDSAILEIECYRHVRDSLECIIDAIIRCYDEAMNEHPEVSDSISISSADSKQNLAEVSTAADPGGCSRNKLDSVNNFSFDSNFFDDHSAVDKIFVQISSGFDFGDLFNENNRVALLSEKNNERENNLHFRNRFDMIDAASVNFFDAICNSYRDFAHREADTIRIRSEMEQARLAEEKRLIALEKKLQKEEKRLLAKEEKLSYSVHFALIREAKARESERRLQQELEAKKLQLEAIASNVEPEVVVKKKRGRKKRVIEVPEIVASEELKPVDVVSEEQLLNKSVIEEHETPSRLTETVEVNEPDTPNAQAATNEADAPSQLKRKRGRRKKVESGSPIAVQSLDGESKANSDEAAQEITVTTAVVNSKAAILDDVPIRRKASTRNVEQKIAEMESKGDGCEPTRNSRLLSDIDRDHWTGMVVTSIAGGEMGRITAAEGGWITVRYASGGLRKFRAYKLEEVDPQSEEFQTFEDAENWMLGKSSDVAESAEPNKLDTEATNSMKSLISTSNSDNEVAGDDYLNMKIDSDFFEGDDKNNYSSNEELSAESKKIVPNEIEQPQSINVGTIPSAEGSVVGSATSSGMNPILDRKFVPLYQKPQKVKYLQFSLSQEVFDKKYKAPLKPPLALKFEKQGTTNKNESSTMKANDNLINSAQENFKKEDSQTSIQQMGAGGSNGSSSINHPTAERNDNNNATNKRTQHRPGSMSRNMRARFSLATATSNSDNENDSSSANDRNGNDLKVPLKTVTIMNKDGDLVTVPATSYSQSSYDSTDPMHLPPQQGGESLSLNGQRLRRQQHILEQQRLLALKTNPSQSFAQQNILPAGTLNTSVRDPRRALQDKRNSGAAIQKSVEAMNPNPLNVHQSFVNGVHFENRSSMHSEEAVQKSVEAVNPNPLNIHQSFVNEVHFENRSSMHSKEAVQKSAEAMNPNPLNVHQSFVNGVHFENRSSMHSEEVNFEGFKPNFDPRIDKLQSHSVGSLHLNINNSGNHFDHDPGLKVFSSDSLHWPGDFQQQNDFVLRGGNQYPPYESNEMIRNDRYMTTPSSTSGLPSVPGSSKRKTRFSALLPVDGSINLQNTEIYTPVHHQENRNQPSEYFREVEEAPVVKRKSRFGDRPAEYVFNGYSTVPATNTLLSHNQPADYNPPDYNHTDNHFNIARNSTDDSPSQFDFNSSSLQPRLNCNSDTFSEHQIPVSQKYEGEIYSGEKIYHHQNNSNMPESEYFESHSKDGFQNFHDSGKVNDFEYPHSQEWRDSSVYLDHQMAQHDQPFDKQYMDRIHSFDNSQSNFTYENQEIRVQSFSRNAPVGEGGIDLTNRDLEGTKVPSDLQSHSEDLEAPSNEISLPVKNARDDELEEGEEIEEDLYADIEVSQQQEFSEAAVMSTALPAEEPSASAWSRERSQQTMDYPRFEDNNGFAPAIAPGLSDQQVLFHGYPPPHNINIDQQTILHNALDAPQYQDMTYSHSFPMHPSLPYSDPRFPPPQPPFQHPFVFPQDASHGRNLHVNIPERFMHPSHLGEESFYEVMGNWR